MRCSGYEDFMSLEIRHVVSVLLWRTVLFFGDAGCGSSSGFRFKEKWKVALAKAAKDAARSNCGPVQIIGQTSLREFAIQVLTVEIGGWRTGTVRRMRTLCSHGTKIRGKTGAAASFSAIMKLTPPQRG